MRFKFRFMLQFRIELGKLFHESAATRLNTGELITVSLRSTRSRS